MATKLKSARLGLHWSAWMIVTVFCALFAVLKCDDNARLGGGAVHTRFAPVLHRLVDGVTDLKYKLHGPTAPTQNIVIVAIDSPTLALVGRWPWHRDAMAALLQAIFDHGAKVAGLDMVFAEADPRVTDDMRQALKEHKLSELADNAETDPQLAQVIAANADKLVLGWQSESLCQPGLQTMADCPVTDSEFWQGLEPTLHKFAVTDATFAKRMNAQATPLQSAVTALANLNTFNAAARHAGYYNAFLDPDGVIRTSFVVALVAGKPHLSLPLAMARAVKAKPLHLQFTDDFRLQSAAFLGEPPLPVDDLARLRARFYGPGRTFRYLSAATILNEDKAALAQLNGAIVLVGLSALGVHDMRNFPFDANVPGVEGQATILDNLLGGTAWQTPAQTHELPVLLLVMALGGLLFALALNRLPAKWGVPVALSAVLAVGVVDVAVLFDRGILFDTGLLYAELALLLGVGLAVKYADEEAKKQFLRNAFARYVPPAVVDGIVNDPSQLALGGDKKLVTILFSDIRGFTTFSERMDAKQLVGFLNHYLGQMTDIVFAHRGTLDKYIGDAVMAFWGAPVALPDNAHQALQAALAMQKAVAAMRESAQYSWGIDLHIGIGLCTGVVNVGNMGSATNFEYTVIGDRVNLASRIESLTKTYGADILTTDDTLAEIAASGQAVPDHRVVDVVRVKGKHDAVTLVEVFVAAPDLAEQAAFGHARAYYLDRQFVDAEAEFAALGDQYHHKLYALYAQRARHWQTVAPPADWAGQWDMESK